MAGSGGTRPIAWRMASGNFAGCAVASVTIGIPGCAGDALGRRDADGGVRIGEVAGRGFERLDGRERRGFVGALGVEGLGELAALALGEREAAALAEVAHEADDAGCVAAGDFEQQPLEVRGDLDVHARAHRRRDVTRLVAAGFEACARGCR